MSSLIDAELWYGFGFLLSIPSLLFALFTVGEQRQAPDWRIPTRVCVAGWGWFGLAFGAFMIFIGGCGVIVLNQNGGADSTVITEYRSGLTGQLLSRTGGSNSHAARDKAIAPLMLAGGALGLLLIPAGIYTLRFSDRLPDVWPRTWAGKPAVMIENLSVQPNDQMAILTLAKPLPKKLKGALIRCVYLCSDAAQPSPDVIESRFAPELDEQTVTTANYWARLVREGNAVCGFVVELRHPPNRFLDGWPTEERELHFLCFPTELELVLSDLQPAEREQRATFAREVSALLARGDGRLFVAMLIYGARMASKVSVSNTVATDMSLPAVRVKLTHDPQPSRNNQK